jgi:hypothetical protein
MQRRKAVPDFAEFIIGLAEGRTRWLLRLRSLSN